jgi:hypothetical protein
MFDELNDDIPLEAGPSGANLTSGAMAGMEIHVVDDGGEPERGSARFPG